MSMICWFILFALFCAGTLMCATLAIATDMAEEMMRDLQRKNGTQPPPADPPSPSSAHAQE